LWGWSRGKNEKIKKKKEKWEEDLTTNHRTFGTPNGTNL
jgi:hypothetical protein